MWEVGGSKTQGVKSLARYSLRLASETPLILRFRKSSSYCSISPSLAKLKIRVLDHVIIGNNRYFSFADQGHIMRMNREFETHTQPR